jgi:phenylpropionate dioxygenase-like ring-hydroxylating dioxygenase large terminal subunit
VARWPKPEPGTWSEHFGLGTGPVSYADSCSPEFFELEREAIFRRAWLHVGRVEQLPRTGAYFTREIEVARTSVVVVRDGDDIRAFHNICRHRGNKLVWQDFPNEETSGTARQFTCKYHAWRYGLDGACTFVQQEGEFFDLDKGELGLVPVHCEVWAGFVFVHLGEPEQSLREFLGPMVTAIEDYPFHRLTERYAFRSTVSANWKLMMDGLQEQYHAPIVHANQRSEEFEEQTFAGGFEAPHYQIDGPHRLLNTGGIRPWELPEEVIKPSEKLLRGGLFGPWDEPDFHADTQIEGMRPGGQERVGMALFEVWPNFGIQLWERGWYHTYQHWPVAHDRHVFEWNMYFVPPRRAADVLAQEMTAVSLKEFGLQDDALIETIQMTLGSAGITDFPVGDQEVLCRHLHLTAQAWVAAHQARQA